MKYLGRIYYEQKGLINLDDIVDIFIEVGNIHNYLENAALRILLFGNPELNFYQCRLLVLKYGESLSQDDLHGRMVFMRMIQLLEANTTGLSFLYEWCYNFKKLITYRGPYV